MKFMYKYHSHTLPESLDRIFHRNNTIHEHNTRHANDPHITSRRTTFASNSLLHKGPQVWYGLPQEIKDLPNIHRFNRHAKKLHQVLFCTHV